MRAIVIALLLLFLGDFLSTFIYHVPQHVFGRLHLTTHHAGHQGFSHYAVLRANSAVLLDGCLGALPYLLLGLILAPVSPWGAWIGLIIGQLHVWWRHTTALGWQTPRLCSGCAIAWALSPQSATGNIIAKGPSATAIFLPSLINQGSGGCDGCAGFDAK